MAKYLVIVESPAKAKTIEKYLGRNYKVVASVGHVRDLPKSQLGIDIENDFEPKYITIRGKGDILAMLRKEVKKADKVYLATDPDREGEAISWHLTKALNLEKTGKKVYRITFNEITKNAVKESLKHPREIDMGLVDAQQARRELDRMVGYRISPLLWAKVKRGLSAGRVQSVALRMICDREDEINAFIPEEYWTLDASFKIPGERKLLTAKYYGTTSQKQNLTCQEDVDKVKKDLDGASYQVTDVKKGERVKKAPLPFTTSTLQQEASKVLNFSTQKTMRLAQQLYEGIDIKGKTVAISGFGNVAWGAVTKATELGAKVVTISGPDGYIYDPDGVSGDKIDYMLELRASGNDIVAPYAEKYPNSTFVAGRRPWEVKVDIALPCATQNELNGEDACNLIKNSVLCIGEISNMGCTPEAIDAFIENKLMYAPGKAVNAGGVATSGLEMSQNAMHMSWSAQEVDDKLHQIMYGIHEQCVKYGTEPDGYINYVKGANIAGFMKVAHAMMAQGIV